MILNLRRSGRPCAGTSDGLHPLLPCGSHLGLPYPATAPNATTNRSTRSTPPQHRAPHRQARWSVAGGGDEERHGLPLRENPAARDRFTASSDTDRHVLDRSDDDELAAHGDHVRLEIYGGTAVADPDDVLAIGAPVPSGRRCGLDRAGRSGSNRGRGGRPNRGGGAHRGRSPARRRPSRGRRFGDHRWTVRGCRSWRRRGSWDRSRRRGWGRHGPADRGPPRGLLARHGLWSRVYRIDSRTPGRRCRAEVELPIRGSPTLEISCPASRRHQHTNAREPEECPTSEPEAPEPGARATISVPTSRWFAMRIEGLRHRRTTSKSRRNAS
jgi:hypothetical protein